MVSAIREIYIYMCAPPQNNNNNKTTTTTTTHKQTKQQQKQQQNKTNTTTTEQVQYASNACVIENTGKGGSQTCMRTWMSIKLLSSHAPVRLQTITFHSYMRHWHCWIFIKNMNTEKVTGDIFLNLKKAFNGIPHKKILEKLPYYGVRIKELKWFKNYLIGRKQCVSIKAATRRGNPLQ